MEQNGLISICVDISRLLSSNNIAHALAGGLAFSLLVRPRTTIDIDIIIAVDETELNLVRQLLKIRYPGIIFHRQVMHLPYVTIYRSVIPNPDEVIIDFILGSTLFLRQAVSRATHFTYNGTLLSVLDLNDLVILKLIAGRPQDILDLQIIRAEFSDQLNLKYIIDWCTELQLDISPITTNNR